MKSVLFGNPKTDWWKLTLDDISVREQVIALDGELSVGFFSARTPMCIEPAVLALFATEARELDKTLNGSATLESTNEQSAVSFVLTVDHVGHVHATGRYEINNNVLDFRFQSDQTQLAPLVRWLDHCVRAYERKAAQPDAAG